MGDDCARDGQSAEGAAPTGARYELDWKTPEQLLVAAVLADGSRDAAVTDVTKVLFARWPDTSALAKTSRSSRRCRVRRRGSLESQARSGDLR